MRLASAIVLAMLFWWMGTGCESQEQADELAELVAESPFRQGVSGSQAGDSLVLVSCRYHPMRVGGQAEVGSWGFWERYLAGREGSAGLDAEAVRRWEENGFVVACAPLSAWGELREAIVSAGGEAGEQGRKLFRRPGEATSFRSSWVGQRRPVAVWEGPAGMRVVTLEPGEAVFKVMCEPRGERGSEGVWVGVELEVLGAQVQERVVKRPTGGWERLAERWTARFESLRLTGEVGPEEFLAVGLRGGTQTETLASVFLREAGEAGQWVAVFVPEVVTADRLEELW